MIDKFLFLSNFQNNPLMPNCNALPVVSIVLFGQMKQKT